MPFPQLTRGFNSSDIVNAVERVCQHYAKRPGFYQDALSSNRET